MLALALSVMTVGAQFSSCPYARDNACFDTSYYTCDSCCATGTSTHGVSCWNTEYTRERCCFSGNAGLVTAYPNYAPAAPAYNAQPVYNQYSEACADKHSECALWTSMGQCTMSSAAMASLCQASCGMCTPLTGPTYTPPVPPYVYSPTPPAYSPPTSSIVALAQATPSLSGLVSALTLQSQRPVLDYLMGPGPFTVFAPTNTAFEALKKLRNPQGISLYDFVMGPGRDVLVSIMCHWP